MERPVLSKNRMYQMLQDGAFGNTLPIYWSVDKWEADPKTYGIAMWGIRSSVPGGPCRLWCPREEVRETFMSPEYQRFSPNITMMVDAVATITLWADVYDSDSGLLVYGIEYPPKNGGWRAFMPSQGKEYRGLSARLLLEKHLNSNSLADLQALRDKWPGHVYELSAMNRCLGTVPHRNAILWECRLY